jgi:hypothetical protein
MKLSMIASLNTITKYCLKEQLNSYLYSNSFDVDAYELINFGLLDLIDT